MDDRRYWRITHRDHDLMNPLDPGDLEETLDRAALPEGARVLDVGCGKGYLLGRLLARGAGAGVGVEIDPVFASEARARARAAGPAADVVVHAMDGKDYAGGEGPFHLAACLGASWIFGGHRATLRALAAWTRPGGAVLVAEPFWVRRPTSGYLAAQALEEGTFGTHAANAAAGVEEGLLLLHARTAPASAWDRYEGLQWNAAEEWARAHPDDPDREAVLARMRGWRDAYLAEGREVLGDGLYLFRKP